MELNITGKRKGYSIIIWLLLYGFFFSLSNYFQPTIQAAWSSAIETFSLLFVYLVTTRYLFPRYFTHSREYLIISLGFILVYTGLIFVIDLFLIDPFKVHINIRPPLIIQFTRNLMGVVFTFFVGTSFRLFEHTHLLKENEKLLVQEKLETELKLLKAQINPHFIFNALNNIYSLTYTKAQNAPDAVLKLSEMLRYVIYDCSKEKVQLASEVKYIENFICFQQMKSDYTQNIKLTAELRSSKIEIAPMLFIPFIENAFKYSRIEENEEERIDIYIAVEEQKVLFKISNGYNENNRPLSGNGMGTANVRHRLEILYPDKHDLKITESDNKFNVELSIFVQQQNRP